MYTLVLGIVLLGASYQLIRSWKIWYNRTSIELLQVMDRECKDGLPWHLKQELETRIARDASNDY